MRRSGLLAGMGAGARLLPPLAVLLLSACAARMPAEDAPAHVGASAAAADISTAPAPPARPAPPSPGGSLAAPPGEGPDDSLFDFPPLRVLEPEPPPRHENLWGRLIAGLRLQRYYDWPEVREQARLYARWPDYFEQTGERARPFLHNIVRQVEQRDMPMEAALIPFVESGFNPHARSPRAATGPWQIMAGTGRSLGLRVDEWFDGRRDPIQAAAAALDYLQIQQQRFAGNWLLAFAAYNAGPAAVDRAVRATSSDPGSADFRELPLPAETRVYVPRILALASMLAGDSEAEFALPDIADEEALERVKVGGGASLALAAEIAGLEPETLRRLNPGFRQWWTPPDGEPDYLHLPAGRADALRLALRQTPGAVRVDAERYRIRPGDTLSGIARAMSVSVDLLRSRNGLDDDLIVAGEYLWIPGLAPDSAAPLAAAAAAGSAAPFTAAPTAHVVQPGDSLWAIARRYGLEVDILAQVNDIPPSAIILPGQELLLAATSAAGIEIYRVGPGDTLGRIASRFGRTLEEILRWNSIKADELIFPGQLLRVAPPAERSRRHD